MVNIGRSNDWKKWCYWLCVTALLTSVAGVLGREGAGLIGAGVATIGVGAGGTDAIGVGAGVGVEARAVDEAAAGVACPAWAEAAAMVDTVSTTRIRIQAFGP